MSSVGLEVSDKVGVGGKAADTFTAFSGVGKGSEFASPWVVDHRFIQFGISQHAAKAKSTNVSNFVTQHQDKCIATVKKTWSIYTPLPRFHRTSYSAEASWTAACCCAITLDHKAPCNENKFNAQHKLTNRIILYVSVHSTHFLNPQS